jgi:RNA polymerase sigma-70 factor (ECF subfamily)
MHRRARARRPAEPLDAYLPQFDANGTHRGTPEELQIVARTDELLDREFLARRVESALERLPLPYRTALVLRDLEELPTAEVAAALGLKPATVRQRVHRARLLMRGFLSDLAGVKS